MMVRIMIVVLLIGSIVLGWMDWQQYQEIQRYEDALKPNGEIEKTVERIQMKAFKYTQYKERSATEGVKGAGDSGSIATYVRERAQDGRVLWGGVQVGAAKEKAATVGKKTYMDTSYKVTPQEKDQSFDRHRIANFFYLLEKDSRKLKITDLDIKTAGKAARPEEIPRDAYDVEFTLTIRERKDSKR
ncbi:hypothetical protein Poly30_05810 [Planctomycetes bacterium Poly30]|uniref:Uncharacterized protein n=1 Tax=Saltatorellus ferox TaxID=2528018 RepID=A0A518ELX2_9BACT|nr:hypothetical protein Poly30_05810 [Planctomycetes bacterium Poly30]